jgi:Cys-rich repeat protein
MRSGFFWLFAAGLCVCAVSACGDSEIALSTSSSEAGAGGAAGSASGGAGGCKDSGQCGGENPFCDPSLGRCVQCVDKQNCASGQSCDPGGNCVSACSGNGDCTISPYRSCDLSFGACVECLTNTDCTSGDHAICVTGRCRECQKDADCASHSEQPYCDLGSYECRQCLSDLNCPNGQHCSDHECRVEA